VPPGAKVFVKIPLTKLVETALQVNVLGRLPSRDSSGIKLLGGVRPMPKSKVFLTSVCEGWTKPFITDDSGRICVTVLCDCDYTVVANQTGYQPGQASAPHSDADCKIDRKCGLNPKQVDVILERVPVDTNRVIELKDIYYDFNKWNIRIESERELNKLLGFLIENPTAILELSSHTDARASKEYNQKLSQRRAQSVFDWLVARGIDGNRLRPVGYGESKPRNRCVDGVVCSEKEHQRNRRTEFRVVGGDFELKSLERFDVEVDPCKNCPF
jgi:outer membrane protein OmpA-like peptidoglycan-associated protein